MSFNKAKAMRNAERYLTQGKIQAAISEYSQIVDQDPKDINTRNMLGDLYTKAGNDGEAVKCYQSVAEYYNSQGFAKKAIAIYNKIHRIEPDSLEVSSKLADLYRTRGSYAEAKKHYENLAAHYESKGQKVEALAMWESIAELDPRNAEIYLKIAESYWHDGRESEAAESFIKAGKRLADCGNHESSVTAYSRALEITPLDFDAVEGLVRSQITLGYPEEAAKTLLRRIENDPYDKESNFLLVECYYDIGDAAAAERVIVKMVERDPSNYRAFLDLIDVYFKNDDLDSAVRVMSMIAEHMLVGGEHEALLVLIEEVLARNPEHIGALRLLARYHAWLKDEGELKSALERVAESARIVGSEDDELFALSQLSALVPHNTEIAARLESLGGSEEKIDSISHFPVKQTGEVPNFESYAVLSNTKDNNEIESLSSASGNQTTENPGETGFEFESFSSGDRVAVEADSVEAEIVSEHEKSATVENAEFVATEQDSQGAGTQSHSTVSDEAASDTGSGGVQAPEELDPTALSAGDEMQLEEEMESIRFYLEQGYNGLADKSLTDLELRFGRRPELVELRDALLGTEFEKPGSAANQPEPSVVEKEQHEHSETRADSSGADNSGEESGPANDPVSPVNGIHETAPAEFIGQAETGEDPRLETAGSEKQHELAELDPQSGSREDSVETGAADGFESGRVDSQTESEDADESNVESPEVVVDSKSQAERELDADLTNTFENFRDELGLSDSDNDDQEGYENHYHHAVAYQEMGLMEEAIREFQHAVNAIRPDDGTKRFLNCCTLLGLCFMEKGMPNLGVVWFQKAFESNELSAEESNGIRYELANALEAGGEFEAAIEEFERIYSTDVDFRDVGLRIEQLTPKIPTPA